MNFHGAAGDTVGAWPCKDKQWVHKLEKSRGCGEYNLGVYYKLSGKGGGGGGGVTKITQKASPGLAVGVRLFQVQERERQRLILFINAQGRPQASSP